MRLLLLEDDPTLGEGLEAFLRGEGHVVEWHVRLAPVRGLRCADFDALLVDWQLPDGSGVDWVRRLRQSGVATPILIMTARDHLADRIHGLDSGADDYLVKPFAPEELSARIRAASRRAAGAGGGRLRLGDVEVDLAQKAVYRHAERIDLTAQEWRLLEALALRAGRIVSRRDLDELIHGGEGEASSNVVEVQLSCLRRKLGHGLVATVRGLGYRIDP